MKYKMLVLDLDDSLLNDDISISEENIEAINNAVDQGVYVTVATGRMHISAKPYVKQLGLDVPVISYNGGLVKDFLTDEVLYRKSLPLDLARFIIEKCEELNLYCQMYDDNYFYVEKRQDYTDYYEGLCGLEAVEVGLLSKYINDDPIKMLIIDDTEKIKTLRDFFVDEMGSQVEIMISKPNYLEFINADTSKGKAVEYLAQKNGIKREEIIAIGDSFNDISMIEYAGLGVAVDNAHEMVKKHADFVTLKNNNNGVAHVIDRFILNGGDKDELYTYSKSNWWT